MQLRFNIQSILYLGLTMVDKLTQNPEVTVLVIECGLDRFPALNSFTMALASPDLTWGLISTKL